MRTVSLILIGLLFHGYLSSQVVINELMSNNEEFVFDDFDEDSDWIELYNPTDTSICLFGWSLTQDTCLNGSWHFPDTCLMSRSFMLLWASGRDHSSERGLHTNFRLSSSGEELRIHNEECETVDSIRFPRLHQNESFGRLNNGDSLTIFLTPTPGQSNTTAEPKPNVNIELTYKDRLLSEAGEVTVNLSSECDQLFYNNTGSRRIGETIEDPPLTNELNLYLNKSQPFYSLIPTALGFKAPSSVATMLPHFTAICRDDDDNILGLNEITFFTNDVTKTYSLPVVNLDVDLSDLFDADFGILVEGENENFRQEGRRWERPAELCYSSSADSFDCYKVLIRVHGHATRELPQKSLKIYQRDTSAGSLKRELFFDDQGILNRIVMRSMHSDHIGNEFTDFGFRDDVIMSIIREDTEVYAQHSRPVAGFINGEYWGLFSLHDASDDDFISSQTGLSKELIDLRTGPVALWEVYQEVKGLNLDLPEDRIEFERHFNLDNLLDYLLLQLFFQNVDWPHNNVKFWKERGSSGPFSFILYDMDATMKSPSNNYLDRFYTEIGISDRLDPRFNQFWKLILSSNHMTERLRQRYYELKQGPLSTSNMLDRLQIWQDQIAPEIDSQSDRWHYPRSKMDWTKSANEIRDFMIRRHLYFGDHIEQLAGSVLYPNPNYTDLIKIKTEASNLFDRAVVRSLDGRLTEEIAIENRQIKLPSSFGHYRGLLLIELKGTHAKRQETVFFF